MMVIGKKAFGQGLYYCLNVFLVLMAVFPVPIIGAIKLHLFSIHSRSLFRKAEGFGRSSTMTKGPVWGALVSACYKEVEHVGCLSTVEE